MRVDQRTAEAMDFVAKALAREGAALNLLAL